MKKVIVLIAAVVMAASVNAQWYVSTGNFGGNLSLVDLIGLGEGEITPGALMFTGIKSVDGETAWGLAPEIGYNLNDKWSVGLGLGYAHFAEKENAYGFNAYARWFGYRNGNFSLYLQADFKYSAMSGDNAPDLNAYSVGVIPGAAYSFNDHFSMNASLGNLGYSKIKDQDGVFSLNINNGLNFGLTYSF